MNYDIMAKPTMKIMQLDGEVVMCGCVWVCVHVGLCTCVCVCVCVCVCWRGSMRMCVAKDCVCKIGECQSRLFYQYPFGRFET